MKTNRLRNRICQFIMIAFFALFALSVGSETVFAAEMTQVELRQRLAPYSEWLEDNNGEIQLRCPRTDISEEELFYYLTDISNLLKGTPGEDYCNVDIIFPYSLEKYGTDINKFADTMFELEDRINYYITNWSDLHSLNFKVGRRMLGTETLNYNVMVELVQNGSFDYSNSTAYYNKLYSIINEAKQYAANDMELVWYFCKWLQDNVIYDEALETNSSYVTIMEERALCGGYANALKDLCSIVGIDTLVPTNKSLVHAWSEVCIDDVWYTIDLCYVVRPIDGEYIYDYFFTNPDKSADSVTFKSFIQSELSYPTPVLNTTDVISIDKGTYNLAVHIRNLGQGATVTYSSSNPNIIQVDNTGNVTAINKGNVIITININVNGKTYTCFQSVTSTYEPQPQIVKPARVKAIKVKNIKGKKVRVTWKKLKNVNGYQIVYATNKKFTKNKKSVTAKKSSTKKVVKKLKKKKTYYFKVRGYKKVNGIKVYGKWSEIKKVKIKK